MDLHSPSYSRYERPRDRLARGIEVTKALSQFFRLFPDEFQILPESWFSSGADERKLFSPGLAIPGQFTPATMSRFLNPIALLVI
jgi:hypothetical protein